MARTYPPTGSQPPSVELTVRQGPQPGQRFSLTRPTITIGREVGNDVVVSDPQVSRRHATLTWDGSHFIIQDLGSANGTFVNGVRLTAPQVLQQGDFIGLGPTVHLGFQAMLPAYVPPRPEPVEGPRPAAPPPAYAPPPPAYAPRPPARRRGRFLIPLTVLLGLCFVLSVAAALGYYFLWPRPEARPLVLINSPRHGEQVEVGQEVTVHSVARDEGKVTRVELWVDGQLQETQSSNLPGGISPFPLLVRWQPLSLGPHTLTARAFNARGSRGQASINVEALKRLDRDNDRVSDDIDDCPDQPGSQTASGCPDRDGDEVHDADDACPDTPGLPDGHGCPVPSADDRDGDDILDSADACPDQPGLYWAQGCPDADDDGILDSADACPREPGLPEQNGCPTPGDRDSDGILDASDACPDEPGLLEQAGCPDDDSDGVRDRDDACPLEYGLPGLAGCPDRDGDGVRDVQDLCPAVAGPRENSGCPITDAGDRDNDGVHDDTDLAPDEPGASEHGGAPPPGGGADRNDDGIPDAEELPGGGIPLWPPPGGGPFGDMGGYAAVIPVELEALEFEVDHEYQEVHCYAGLAGEDMERYDFEPLGETHWDIASVLGGENSRTVAVHEDEPLEVRVECWASNIYTEPPEDSGTGISEGHAWGTVWKLGSFTANHPREDWDGHVLNSPPLTGGDEGHPFRAQYRICEGSCEEAAFAPPILSLYYFGGVHQLIWLWEGDRANISGFRLYINGSSVGYVGPDRYYLVVDRYAPPCGERFTFQLSTYRLDRDGTIRESPLSNEAYWSARPCLGWGTPAPDEQYRYLVEKPWYEARNGGYYPNPNGHLAMFRTNADPGDGAYKRYLAEFWGPYGTGKVKSSATGGRYLEYYCDNVEPAETAQPGVNCLDYRPSPDDIENVFFFSTGNSGWKYGPNLAASTIKTDEDPFVAGEYEREYNVHSDGWPYYIIKEWRTRGYTYNPGNTLLVIAAHPGYPWNLDDKAANRADYIEWFRQRTNNFKNVKRIVLGGYSRGGVLALALGKELRLAFHQGADWYQPAHTQGVKLVVLSLDPGGSENGDGLELQDGNMNIPNDGGSGHYGSGHCHRLDIAYSMGINESQTSYWVKTYVKNVIGESIFMDCAFHKADCSDRGDHQSEYTFCIDGSPWEGGSYVDGCPGPHNRSTWLRQHISAHERNNHGDMGTHSRPELVEHYLNFMSYWLFGEPEFLK